MFCPRIGNAAYRSRRNYDRLSYSSFLCLSISDSKTASSAPKTSFICSCPKNGWLLVSFGYRYDSGPAKYEALEYDNLAAMSESRSRHHASVSFGTWEDCVMLYSLLHCFFIIFIACVGLSDHEYCIMTRVWSVTLLVLAERVFIAKYREIDRKVGKKSVNLHFFFYSSFSFSFFYFFLFSVPYFLAFFFASFLRYFYVFFFSFHHFLVFSLT